MTHAHPPDPVERALESSALGETVLAAVSGGPDSMAMFHALCRLALRRGGPRIVAAHFNHGLRPGSEHDVEVVMRVAAEFGARVVSDEADVATHARASRQSIEAAARELRYRFLENIAAEIGADEILTAHTRDDQIETVVMRLIRGAGVRGLRGISPRMGSIARPLLAVTHDETVAYCEHHGVPFVLDPSNNDVRFFRNRVRHEILPALRGSYPRIDTMLERLSSNARLVFDEASLALDERTGDLRSENGRWVLPRESFDGLDSMHCVILFMKTLSLIGVHDNVTRAHYGALLGLVPGARPGASVDLPRIRVRREHDGLVFMRRDGGECTADVRVLGVPGTTRMGNWTLTAQRICGSEAREAIPRREANIAYLATDGSLTVRFPREGDRMRPLGMNGHKKLSDIFIDEKVPRRVRALTPLVECNGEILWVVGVATGEAARVHNLTREVIRLAAARVETA